MEKKQNNISKASTENSFIDDLKKYFPPELYEKYTQPGVLEKICKAYFDIELPIGMHKKEYLSLCRVHAVLAKRYRVNPSEPVNVSELAVDPELLEASKPFKERTLKDYIISYLDFYKIPRRTKNQGRPKDK